MTAAPLALLVPLATLTPVAIWRFLDGDEGDYAAAAALVLDGKVLYRDFLYTQTPLLPYVYGLWAEIAGERWLAMRALSVAFALALAVLLYRHLAARVGERLAALGVALFGLSSLVIVWYPTFKTYALSTLLLFAAYTLVAATPWRTAFAGAAAALAVETRALLVGGAVVLAWAAWRAGRRHFGAFAGGSAVALLPSLALFAIDADRFLFGNLWYHGARSEGGLVGDFEQKAEVVANLVGIATEARPLPQYLLLVIASVAGAFALRRLTGVVPLAFLVAVGLAVVALVPTPTYAQYFATTVPFLVVVVVLLVRELDRTPFVTALGAVAGVAYVGFGIVDAVRIVRPSHEDRPQPVQAVGDWIDARTEPGEEVMASWPGYLFGTDADPVPGLENAFSTHEAAAVGEEKSREQHLVSVGDVERMIRDRRTRFVVVKVWHDLEPIPDYAGAASEAGYRLVADVNNVRIFERP